MRDGRRIVAVSLLLPLLAVPVASSAELRTPAVAIIIDDLGHRLAEGERAAALPGPVACSILPYTPLAGRLAEACHAAGKEILLHLPMQPADLREDPGPGALMLRHDRRELITALRASLASVPYVSGVNNHMGSLLTRNLAKMQWVMAELKGSGTAYFVDSYTTSSSVALRVARANGLPTIRRDIFLDVDPTPAAVTRQLQRLVDEARSTGFALGIGHPFPATLTVLERALPMLAADGIMLVSVADLVRRSTVEEQPWIAAYSYPSHPASKR